MRSQVHFFWHEWCTNVVNMILNIANIYYLKKDIAGAGIKPERSSSMERMWWCIKVPSSSPGCLAVGVGEDFFSLPDPSEPLHVKEHHTMLDGTMILAALQTHMCPVSPSWIQNLWKGFCFVFFFFFFVAPIHIIHCESKCTIGRWLYLAEAERVV